MDPLRRRRLMLIGIGVVVVLVGVVVIVKWRSTLPTGERVLIVGDSVTVISDEELVAAFDWTDHLDVQGRVGFRTGQLVPVALQAVQKDKPEILVVLTGYNDLLQAVDAEKALGQMMDIAASVRCAVWVLLPLKSNYPAADAEDINEVVQDLAADHPSVHVTGEWRDVVDGLRGPDPNPELISGDHIHPTPAGSARLAEIEQAAVTSNCR